MRNLFILRGAPASGKSTWIKENNLEPYTLSTDQIRLLYQSPVTDEHGNRVISQQNDGAVWKLLYELLEKRMEKGEFIIIDATHYKSSLISSYKSLTDKYRYRVNVVDFSDIDEEECLRRNAERDAYKRVPEDVIKKMYACIRDDSEVKKAFKLISRAEATMILKSPLTPVKIDESVLKVVIFGDVHGCYTPLKEYFDKNPFRDDYCYIFTGDYLDRGLENKEVLEFLLSIYDKPNVFMLEGNHEKWLRIFGDKNYKKFEKHKVTEYDDFFVDKFIAQLEDKQKQLKNIIEKDTFRLKELNDIISEAKSENPNVEEVFFEFESVPISLRDEISGNIGRMKFAIDIAEKYITLLRHEKFSTSSEITTCKVWYEETFGEPLSFNIKNKVAEKLNMSENKEDNPIKSAEFVQNTIPQIAGLSKEQIRQFCRRLIQMSYFEFHGKKYLVTHGGVPCLPDIFTPSVELIKGVGKYEDHELIDKTFAENEEVIQIHGHRNVLRTPISSNNGFTYNLEGQVEDGGEMRIIEISKDGVNTVEIPNKVYRHEEVIIEEKTDLEILKDMVNSKFINVKNLDDNIISLNFNKEVFYDKKWNELTCKARGLFVDKTNGNIVARSFSKFFNAGEREETKLAGLKENFVFPIVGYGKENGFLGIVSKYNDKVRFFSKSMDNSQYTNIFIGVLCDIYNIKWVGGASYMAIYQHALTTEDLSEKVSCLEAVEQMKQQLKNILAPLITEGYSYIFECVDIKNDPHIIKYDKNNVFLLEVFKNQLKEEHVSWEDLISISDALHVSLKQRELEFDTWEEFYQWQQNFETSDCKHEGYVFEDSNGFRVKYKSPFYKFWKEMRAIKDRIILGRENKKVYKTKKEIQVVKLMEELGREKLQNMSIIDVEDMFYERFGE